MSQLGWIDFSPDDRSKVRSVLASLSEPGTLDELGIGQVRDAFSDLLFPGISTIQTRAKYYITVPRILRDYLSLTPSQRKRYQSLQKYLADHENELAKRLDAIHEAGEKGIIGRTRINQGGVARRPSEVYWNGLRTFGLVKTQLSLADFCRHMDSNDLHGDVSNATLDEGNDDADNLKGPILVSLPDRISDWMSEDKLRIELSYKEAGFLKGKMVESPDIAISVPAQIFKHGVVDQVLADNENENIKAIDALTSTLLSHDSVDGECKRNIKLANEFSLALEGPHIRYNFLLAKKNNHVDKIKQYKVDYEAWLDGVRTKDLFTANCAGKWLSVVDTRAIKSGARRFIQDCCDILQKDSTAKQLDLLVKSRVDANKGPRSLLKRNLKSDKWNGIRRMDYRWGSAKVLIKDIRDGLHAGS